MKTAARKDLNKIMGVAFASALYNWLEDQYEDHDRQIALDMAESVSNLCFKLLKRMPVCKTDHLNDIQARVDKLKKRAWAESGEYFQSYICFTEAVLEDLKNNERFSKQDLELLDDILDSCAGLLLHFDSDYEDTESAERAQKAFRQWKIIKF